MDFWPGIPNPATGKTTRREFLNLELVKKPKNELDKAFNREVMLTAETLLNQRKLQLANQQYGFVDKSKQRADFIAFFKELGAKRQRSTAGIWTSALKHLVDFAGETYLFKDVNEVWCDDFKDYLKKATSRRSSKHGLKINSAVSYYGKFIAAIKQAHAKGFLQVDLARNLTPIKGKDTHRQYLTHEELQTAARTPCSNEVLKRAGLFSALTGLRFSDIQKLTWKEIELSNDGWVIKFWHKKTTNAQTLPISEDALKLLGDRAKPGDHVFPGLKYSTNTSKQLRSWLRAAGIPKDCTFHSFRHTNATLLLDEGVDLYVISKLLGHKDISSTSRYTQVLDHRRREAANKIKINL
ncbi:site-specific integrase [Flaviaesturariibacter amylovorans]|uniref:tyrosine-type recombinase/integrase n=1 Tax=Flaviaesturariibacter amylovorans TaxID=1084520 RepID=UPI0031F1049F